MFLRSIVALIFLLFVGHVFAAPLAGPEIHGGVLRRTASANVKRQDIPVELAVTAPDGRVKLYRRQDIPVEVAVTAPDGRIRQYKRQDIPVEVAVTAPDGQVRPYKRQIPAEVAVRAPEGKVELY